MVLGEMIEILQDMMDRIEQEHGEDVAYDTQVHLAVQPSYPMQYSVGDMAVADGKVYIAEAGFGNDYLPSAAREELGW